MDVDDDEGTQRPRRVPDYGIEVDFDLLTDEEREVRTIFGLPAICLCRLNCFRTGPLT